MSVTTENKDDLACGDDEIKVISSSKLSSFRAQAKLIIRPNYKPKHPVSKPGTAGERWIGDLSLMAYVCFTLPVSKGPLPGA